MARGARLPLPEQCGYIPLLESDEAAAELGGEAGQVKRHIKRLSNLNAQKDERAGSAHWLAENGSEEAILGLLKRFELTYEHRMKDTEEKKDEEKKEADGEDKGETKKETKVETKE